MNKKRLNVYLLLIAGLLIFVTGCSPKKDVNTKNDFKTVAYFDLSKSKQKQVQLVLSAKDETKKSTSFDLEINNQSKDAVAFNTKKFSLNIKDTNSIKQKKIVVNPGKSTKLTKIFKIKDSSSLTVIPKLIYDKKEISGVVLKAKNEATANKLFGILNEKQSQNSEEKDTTDTTVNENDEEEVNTNSEEDSPKDISSITDSDWIQGMPDQLIGDYVYDKQSDDEVSYDLKITQDMYRLNPRAQASGFMLNEVKYVQLDKNTFLIKGQALIYTTIYEKITIQPDGNITVSESKDTPNNLSDNPTLFRKA